MKIAERVEVQFTPHNPAPPNSSESPHPAFRLFHLPIEGSAQLGHLLLKGDAVILQRCRAHIAPRGQHIVVGLDLFQRGGFAEARACPYTRLLCLTPPGMVRPRNLSDVVVGQILDGSGRSWCRCLRASMKSVSPWRLRCPSLGAGVTVARLFISGKNQRHTGIWVV